MSDMAAHQTTQGAPAKARRARRGGGERSTVARAGARRSTHGSSTLRGRIAGASGANRSKTTKARTGTELVPYTPRQSRRSRYGRASSSG